jgi:hypothetical protein
MVQISAIFLAIFVEVIHILPQSLQQSDDVVPWTEQGRLLQNPYTSPSIITFLYHAKLHKYIGGSVWKQVYIPYVLGAIFSSLIRTVQFYLYWYFATFPCIHSPTKHLSYRRRTFPTALWQKSVSCVISHRDVTVSTSQSRSNLRAKISLQRCKHDKRSARDNDNTRKVPWFFCYWIILHTHYFLTDPYICSEHRCGTLPSYSVDPW